MIVVSDTSPLNYLLLIRHVDVLPALFGRVIIPSGVLAELHRPQAPTIVRTWASSPPAWLEIQSPKAVSTFPRLGIGEAEAIALAQELCADLLLIDERDGTETAARAGLRVVGTLGVLKMAADDKLLLLDDAISELRTTTFRASPELMDRILRGKDR